MKNDLINNTRTLKNVIRNIIILRIIKMNILKIEDVMDITKLGRSTIYAWINKKEFPSQIKLGRRASGWVEDDVLKWIQDKKDKTLH